MKYYLVLVHSRTKFELNYSKFAQVSQLEKIFKKFESFNRFWTNSIPKVLARYNIFVCSYRRIDQILRKLQLLRIFFKKFKMPYNHKLCINRHDWKVVTDSLVYQILNWYLKRFMSDRGLKSWKLDTNVRARASTHIRTAAKNRISRRFRLLWVLWYWCLNSKRFRSKVSKLTSIWMCRKFKFLYEKAKIYHCIIYRKLCAKWKNLLMYLMKDRKLNLDTLGYEEGEICN